MFWIHFFGIFGWKNSAHCLGWCYISWPCQPERPERVLLVRSLTAWWQDGRVLASDRTNFPESMLPIIYLYTKKTASFKWPFDPPNGGHLTPTKGLLWIQTMSLWRTCRFFQGYIHTFRPYKWRKTQSSNPKNLPVVFFAQKQPVLTTPLFRNLVTSQLWSFQKKRWSRDQVCWKWYLWEWFLEW